jgi:hypothetical protein
MDLEFPTVGIMENIQRCEVFFMLLPTVYLYKYNNPTTIFKLQVITCFVLLYNFCDYKVTPTSISDDELEN